MVNFMLHILPEFKKNVFKVVEQLRPSYTTEDLEHPFGKLAKHIQVKCTHTP